MDGVDGDDILTSTAAAKAISFCFRLIRFFLLYSSFCLACLAAVNALACSSMFGIRKDSLSRYAKGRTVRRKEIV